LYQYQCDDLASQCHCSTSPLSSTNPPVQRKIKNAAEMQL
jgi:hypothetical protein